jgi:carbamoyl-phosphate synthase/aspartate carbamoyltransferase/dihydroorotase
MEIRPSLDSQIFRITPANVHVHLRDFEESYKETIHSGTIAALAGGFCLVLDMPNNKPPIINIERLKAKLDKANSDTSCYYGAYVVGTNDNQVDVFDSSRYAVGLKLYLNQTHGDLMIDDESLEKHFQMWKGDKPICTHAEGATVDKVLRLCAKYQKPVHICHVAEAYQIERIKMAKEAGLPVTCEVAVHHFFLNDNDAKTLGGFGYVKPELKPQRDVDALWRNIDAIDILTDDSAPHTIDEKKSESPPPGFPGLEATIPLMLNAVVDGRLTLEKLVDMICTKPKKIFNLPDLGVTYAKFDLSETYRLKKEDLKTKCGWSPFEMTGHFLTGRVMEVCIKGEIVYKDGEFLDRFMPVRNGSTLVLNYYNDR